MFFLYPYMHIRRFHDVYTALNLPPNNLQNIDIWNLRGRSVPMDKLAPKLIRRAAKKNYIAIMIDPIYKVITGDENSADQMAHFCNQFDKVCTELGCAVIYCHHHSKGSQGGKRSMDRASGSGVFARDPDALLDLIELETNEGLLEQEENKAVCALCMKWLKRFRMENEASQDDLYSKRAMLDLCKTLLKTESYNLFLDDLRQTEKDIKNLTAWRVEGTLREFPKFAPVNMWFDYPVHRTDTSGVLGDIKPEGDAPLWQRARQSRKPKAVKEKERKSSIETAYSACTVDENITLTSLSEYLGVSEKTVRRYIKEHGGYKIEGGNVRTKTENVSVCPSQSD